MNWKQNPGNQKPEMQAKRVEIKWLTPETDELVESLLDDITGGINPQPLPPRGDDFRKGNRPTSYIGETEKY